MRKDEFVNGYIALNQKNLPKKYESLRKLESKLNAISEQQQGKVYDVKMKNPKVAFLLSIFSLDRFYNGQPILGILKIITFGGLGIWAFIDLFLAAKKTREDNLQRLLDMPVDTSSYSNDPSFAERVGSEIGQHIQDTITDAVKDKAGKFVKEKVSNYVNGNRSESQDPNMLVDDSEYSLESEFEESFDEDEYEEDFDDDDDYDDED